MQHQECAWAARCNRVIVPQPWSIKNGGIWTSFWMVFQETTIFPMGSWRCSTNSGAMSSRSRTWLHEETWVPAPRIKWDPRKNTSPAEPKKCGSAVDTQLRHMAPANVLWYITPLIQRKLATMAKRHMGYLEKCHPQVLQCIGLGFPHSNHQNLDVPILIAWNKLWYILAAGLPCNWLFGASPEIASSDTT